MDEVRIKLSALWTALMLTYLLGDVMRIFSGDVEAGMIDGQQATQAVWLLAAAIMFIPIVMIVLSLMLNRRVNRWVNIIVAIFFVLFNLIGLPYPSAYDNFLLVASFGFNALIVRLAWKWG